ncbi:Nicotinate-nucleotide adenylyltransferase [Halanaerobium saccharolyticum subsp. saccharolyticum DSM 6643]|uniref:Probable nicotinate-nucleotide adenylyltransferase n=1 Tax=Halanaerobium saccharolyticum subsp. saccharolyticum DSM 6643 TaxID=1293054 RepID=M5DXT8_9FIRM|nr:nicotinate-nucleotide adenylyltransferase [Halanaerobium saccharolyticum]CCU78194.1 Nicotinate-nucleotide adenylyltransferase [Halanaerobium saccharolyticum subsp. saccharolyticum DSM 6643]
MSKKSVAIFGGTFDPPHQGHFILAEQLKNNFGLTEIMFMPTGKPPHKKDKVISPNEDRLNMLKLAVEENDFFSLSDWELQNEGYSYTAKTLAHFVPQIDAEEVFFIIGADSLAEIFKWKNPEYLLSEANFIVFNRPGYDLKEITSQKKYETYLDNIFTYQGLNIEISSSFIRDEIEKGNSIRYLTLDKIEKYIEENNLYR